MAWCHFACVAQPAVVGNKWLVCVCVEALIKHGSLTCVESVGTALFELREFICSLEGMLMVTAATMLRAYSAISSGHLRFFVCIL